jgi:hypothetical protein
MMDFNEYVAEVVVSQRLAELRERGAQLARLRASQPARPRPSRWIGSALIRVGHWLAQGRPSRARNAGVRLAR